MSHTPIPAGYHDAESAAKLLGISKRHLLKHLRELGWLIVGGDTHNLPRKELKAAGWLATQERAHCLKGKKEIVKNYQVMLLTQAGFQELKKNMIDKKTETPETVEQARKIVPIKNAIKQTPAAVEAPYNKQAADIERKKSLLQMQEWGLPIATGRI